MLRFKRSCKSLRPCLFLLSRVCSQNRQIRKQTWASVPAFVYQNTKYVNNLGKVFMLLFLLSRVCSQNRQIRKQSRASVPAFVYQMGQKGNKRGNLIGCDCIVAWHFVWCCFDVGVVLVGCWWGVGVLRV